MAVLKHADESTVECPDCKGEGTVSIPYMECDPRRWTTCPICHGSGKVCPVYLRRKA